MRPPTLPGDPPSPPPPQDMFNLLPNMSAEHLSSALAVKSNDMMAVVYLAALIRCGRKGALGSGGLFDVCRPLHGLLGCLARGQWMVARCRPLAAAVVARFL